MRKVLFAFLVVIAFSSNALASSYLFSATSRATRFYSDFSFKFDSNDNEVAISDVYDFSGVTDIFWGDYYSDVNLFPKDFAVDGFTFLGSGYNSGDSSWRFGEGNSYTWVPARYWSYDITEVSPSATPIPGAIWLLGSGIVGLVGVRRKMKV